MSLATLCLAAFLVLASISQYFLMWIRFGTSGLIVIGAIGLAAGVLCLLEGFGVWSYNTKR